MQYTHAYPDFPLVNICSCAEPSGVQREQMTCLLRFFTGCSTLDNSARGSNKGGAQPLKNSCTQTLATGLTKGAARSTV